MLQMKQVLKKNVLKINNDIKLISWEDENEMIFEQYDENDELVDRVVHKKGTQTATSYTKKDGRTEICIDLPKERKVSSSLATVKRARSTGNRVDTVDAENTVTSTRKQMYVYEKSQVYATDYVLPSKSMTVAKLAASIVIGLTVSINVANYIVGALVSTGLCVLSDKLISCFRDKVRANRCEKTYYGKDKQTYKKSSDYKGGREYTVTSPGNQFK